MTVGFDTAMGLALVIGDYVTTFPSLAAFGLVLLLFVLVATVFAVQFLYTAWRLRAEVLLSLRRKLTPESSEKAHIAHLCMWLALSGIAMLVQGLVCASSYAILLAEGATMLNPDSDHAAVSWLVSCWAIAYYGRVATSFAQVMSLRIVPNSPVVDEVLFGGSSPSSFRRGRLLPRWLLLSREVDRTTSSRVHHDSEQGPEEEEDSSVPPHTAQVVEIESSDSRSEPRSESRLKQLG